MEMTIDLPGGMRVDAHIGDLVVKTDQPTTNGGENTAPSPFVMFLSTIGTCVGFYVLSFCRQREIPTEGIRIVQRTEADPATKMITDVRVTVELPEGFPAKYTEAVVRATDQCPVKKHFEHPPVIRVESVTAA